MATHPVDIHVGGRLRLRRKMMGLSQEELGKPVGITFQQVQKYEKGTNRIGSSRLFEFAALLNVPVSYFFDGFSGSDAADGLNYSFAENLDSEVFQLESRETRILIESYYAIDNPQVRRKMLSLIKSLKPK